MRTAKKTFKVIEYQPENETKIQTLDYLRKFVRSLDAAVLATFSTHLPLNHPCTTTPQFPEPPVQMAARFSPFPSPR